MRKHLASIRQEDDENEINLTPMLDVVFIMLIFFIVTASFIRETGLEANAARSDRCTAGHRQMTEGAIPGHDQSTRRDLRRQPDSRHAPGAAAESRLCMPRTRNGRW